MAAFSLFAANPGKKKSRKKKSRKSRKHTSRKHVSRRPKHTSRKKHSRKKRARMGKYTKALRRRMRAGKRRLHTAERKYLAGRGKLPKRKSRKRVAAAKRRKRDALGHFKNPKKRKSSKRRKHSGGGGKLSKRVHKLERNVKKLAKVVHGHDRRLNLLDGMRSAVGLLPISGGTKHGH